MIAVRETGRATATGASGRRTMLRAVLPIACRGSPSQRYPSACPRWGSTPWTSRWACAVWSSRSRAIRRNCKAHPPVFVCHWPDSHRIAHPRRLRHRHPGPRCAPHSKPLHPRLTCGGSAPRPPGGRCVTTWTARRRRALTPCVSSTGAAPVRYERRSMRNWRRTRWCAGASQRRQTRAATAPPSSPSNSLSTDSPPFSPFPWGA